MDVSVVIPLEVEAALRAAGLEPAAAFREAALVQLYRDELITGPQLRTMLGVDRYALDGILKRHGIDFISVDEMRAEIAKVRGHASRAAS